MKIAVDYMVQNYKHKTNRHSWSQYSLKNVLNALENGTSLRAVLIEFQIPKTTLDSHFYLGQITILSAIYVHLLLGKVE